MAALRPAFAAVALAAAAATAAEPDTAPPAAETEPTRFNLEFGWDAGPTYALVQHFPELQQCDPLGLVKDIFLVGRLGGSLYLDGGYLGGDALDNGFEGRIRRARFFTRGTFTRWFPTEYKFEFAVESSRVFLNDFFLRWRFSRYIDSLRFGYFDPPVNGLSLQYAFAGSGQIQYRARPESFLAPFVVDTGPITSGDATLLGLEAAWQHGPVSIQAEYFASFVNGDDVGARTFRGAYVQASWVLTGEQRPYDRATALFGRVEAREPFAPLRGGWGALEVAWRVSWLTLSDGPVRGGRLVVATVGPAWVLNRWVRIEAGYCANPRGGLHS